MSGKKTKKMAKKKIRTWSNPGSYKGVENTENSLTMPDMQNDPRTVLQNHVRGINPITGAVLDRQRYYGDAIMPYGKDLTYEELKIKREALEAKAAELSETLKPTQDATETTSGDQGSEGSTGNETVGEDSTVS